MGMLSNDPRPVVNTGPGRTKQSFKEECDVHFIVDKFARTGLITHLAAGTPRFADVSELGSYREAIEQLRAAQEYFEGLPARVRAMFDNDPARYIEALQDPDAAELLEQAGAALYPKKGEQPQERREEPEEVEEAVEPPSNE